MVRTTKLLETIEQFVVVLNPESTNGHKAESYIKALRRAQPKQPVVVVEIGDEQIVQKRLLAALAQAPAAKQLIVIAGGDGTVHLVISALMRADTPASLRRAPLTAWPLGNGNDFFHSTHTKAAERDALGIFAGEPQLTQVHPLKWEIRPDQGMPFHKFSLCYGTLGATGKATKMINEATHRERRKTLNTRARLAHDITQGAPAILAPEKFNVTINGSVRTLVEMQFVNGPIMTIHGRYNMRLSEQAMFVSMIEQSMPLSTVVSTARMVFGVLGGNRTADPVVFTLAQPVSAQVDGEHFELPAGTVTVGPSKTALTIWATKPI